MAIESDSPQRLFVGIPLAFGVGAILASTTWYWPTRWLLSGTPFLTLALLLGASNGYRILNAVPLVLLIGILNLTYAIASTSWLLYGVFTFFTYPAIFFTCLCQFDRVARTVRHGLRKLIRQLHFVNESIALFEIPALEIDVDVEGLMVIRGMTISLSTLTVTAHGIEVGIKLAKDLEVAISTEKVVVSLFRGIEISDCYANIKGGLEEMTFGELDETDSGEEGGVVVESTPLLVAAGSRSRRPHYPRLTSIAERKNMKDSAPKAGWKSIRKLHPDDQNANDEYDRLLKHIVDTNAIATCRQSVAKQAGNVASAKDRRAAICSEMQSTPTVPHPPTRSIKVTTLQTLSSPRTRGFLHRLPLLLRLLLNPIAYFHPVKISSITAGGSGRRAAHMLKTHLLKDYAQHDRELRKLEKRILRWLADANFVVELDDVTGVASVPITTTYDIIASLRFGDVLAYRALEKEVSLQEVMRLAGADATFEVPSYLLPHHEHILPPKLTPDERCELEAKVAQADGKPNQMKAAHELEQAEQDETNMRLSAHVQLPASCSQELLNFAATLVKASKIVEIEKEPTTEPNSSGIKEFGHALSGKMKDGVKHALVAGVINDKWIAKMVGKVVRHLEAAQGDVGWMGDIPIKLDIYRLPEGHRELSKLLP
jgi:hypothetical protein